MTHNEATEFAVIAMNMSAKSISAFTMLIQRAVDNEDKALAEAALVQLREIAADLRSTANTLRSTT